MGRGKRMSGEKEEWIERIRRREDWEGQVSDEEERKVEEDMNGKRFNKGMKDGRKREGLEEETEGRNWLKERNRYGKKEDIYLCRCVSSCFCIGSLMFVLLICVLVPLSKCSSLSVCCGFFCLHVLFILLLCCDVFPKWGLQSLFVCSSYLAVVETRDMFVCFFSSATDL